MNHKALLSYLNIYHTILQFPKTKKKLKYYVVEVSIKGLMRDLSIKCNQTIFTESAADTETTLS
jgi:hypothetical protein